MSRDRCYLIEREGKPPIRIRAGKRPDKRTAEALGELFDAAYRRLSEKQKDEPSGEERVK
jgi:hypothetical protein